MLKIQRIDDATYLVTDPRFTHQPEARFPSGRSFPNPERLLGPLAVLTFLGIAVSFLMAAAGSRRT